MRIVVEVDVGARPGFLGMPLCPHTRRELHDAGHHIGELVGNDRRDQKQEDCGMNDTSSGSGSTEDREVSVFSLARNQSRSDQDYLPSVFAPNITRLAIHNTINQGDDVDDREGGIVDQYADANTDHAKHWDKEPEKGVR